jgi:photosystem II stability/assembly factor-like uncharacterized protein
LQVVTQKVGYAVMGFMGDNQSYGYLVKTSDAGITWTVVRSDDSDITEVFFISEMEGWIFTSKNEIFKTIDGANTWTSIPHNETITNPKVFFLDNLNGYAAQSNKIFVTADGGLTWTKDFENLNYNFTNLLFTNEGIGFVIDANGKLLRKVK